MPVVNTYESSAHSWSHSWYRASLLMDNKSLDGNWHEGWGAVITMKSMLNISNSFAEDVQGLKVTWLTINGSLLNYKRHKKLPRSRLLEGCFAAGNKGRIFGSPLGLQSLMIQVNHYVYQKFLTLWEKRDYRIMFALDICILENMSKFQKLQNQETMMHWPYVRQRFSLSQISQASHDNECDQEHC